MIQEATDHLRYEDLPDVAELGPRLMKKAAELMTELSVVVERQKADDELATEIKDKLQKLQTEAELPGLRFMGLCFVSRQTAGRRTLDKMMLIENGVEADVIEQSMKTGKPFLTRTFVNLADRRK